MSRINRVKSQADHPLLVGAVVDWNLSNEFLLFIEEIHMNNTAVAWVSGLPKGLGERRFEMSSLPFSLPSFPFSPETPDTQAITAAIICSKMQNLKQILQ